MIITNGFTKSFIIQIDADSTTTDNNDDVSIPQFPTTGETTSIDIATTTSTTSGSTDDPGYEATTKPNSTEPHSTEAGSEQPSGGNSVLAIVLGIMGGLIALLLVAVLVVLIIGQRMKAAQQTSAIQEHRYI